MTFSEHVKRNDNEDSDSNSEADLFAHAMRRTAKIPKKSTG
jgi:hypothetical protein